MKLRNKKTGEIIEKFPETLVVNSGRAIYTFNTLAELNEEWEDYEKPKDHWFMDCCGDVYKVYFDSGCVDTQRKQIGNYFETKEEAEKAVEKLKAWKRLKDNGFKFTGFEETDRGCLGDFTIYCYVKTDYTRTFDEVKDDLDLLFGGE